MTGTQKVDPTKTPKAIDISDDSGPNKGKTCLGIYEFKGEAIGVGIGTMYLLTRS